MWEKGSVAVGYLQDAFLLVGPGAVRVHRHVHPVAERAERLVEEWVGQDPVDLGTDLGPQLELGGVRFDGAAGQQDLSPRDAEGEDDGLGGRLPQPVADLVVEGLTSPGLTMWVW